MDKDTVRMIDKFGEDRLTELLERNENTTFKENLFVKMCQNGLDEQLTIRAKQDFVRWSQIEQNGIKPG